MKLRATLTLLLLSLTLGLSHAQAQAPGKAHHVVLVWLKQHGDENARRQYIEGTKHLAEIPGVLAYRVGTPAGIKRAHPSPSLDDSYDIAVYSNFENAQALENYLNHPKHGQVVKEILKQLVEKYKAYDFVE
ncbi:MAG: Dabb family protein [Gammaproteobacteria bacterium]